MTWEELAAHISVMDESQKKTDVTIYNKSIDEFFRSSDIGFTDGAADVLDPYHPYLEFEE